MEIGDISELYENLHVKYVQKYNENTTEETRGEYQRWYEFILNSPYFYIFIVKDEDNNLKGLIKYELSEECAIVSIYLAESVRGKKHSQKLLRESFEEIKKIWKIDGFEAYILKENTASINLFKSLNFKFEKNADYNGIKHSLYIQDINK